MPNNLTVISECAFCGCSSLDIITIPSSIEYIDTSAFKDCYNLKEIIFEDENYKEKEGLQDFIKKYKDKIKVRSLDDIIKENTKILNKIENKEKEYEL